MLSYPSAKAFINGPISGRRRRKAADLFHPTAKTTIAIRVDRQSTYLIVQSVNLSRNNLVGLLDVRVVEEVLFDLLTLSRHLRSVSWM